MTPEEFCRWLKGYAELAENAVILTARQWTMVKNHLDLVYNKVTPERYHIPLTLPDIPPSWYPNTPLCEQAIC